MKSYYEFGVIDMDGTVLDSKKLHRKIIKVVSLLNHPGLLYVVSSCTPFSNFFRQLPFKNSEKLGLKLDRIIFDLFEITDKKVVVYEGAREALKELYQNGMKLFATTVSRTERTKKILRELELQLFELVLGADILPKQEHISYFANYLGLTLEEFARKAFYLGDSTYDMIFASKYYIHGIGITNTLDGQSLIRAGAKTIIGGWQELKFFLK